MPWSDKNFVNASGSFLRSPDDPDGGDLTLLVAIEVCVRVRRDAHGRRQGLVPLLHLLDLHGRRRPVARRERGLRPASGLRLALRRPGFEIVSG